MGYRGLIKQGVGLSIGASVIDAMPANAAKAGAQQGIQAYSSFLPAQGAILGGQMVLKQLKRRY